MTGRTRETRTKAWLVWVLVSAGILLVAGANVHLIYVAVQSQPSCVEHSKAAGDGHAYRAAKPAC
jgi:hypothetical protein